MLADRESEKAATGRRTYRLSQIGFQWSCFLIGLAGVPMWHSSTCTDSLFFAIHSSGAGVVPNGRRGSPFRPFRIASSFRSAKEGSIRQAAM